MDIKKTIEESIRVKKNLMEDDNIILTIQQVAQVCIESLNQGGRILFCGNGGSAADAQHLAAELSGRFYYDRDPLDAEALHVNTSYLTAVANDYSFDEVYARQVKAKGKKGDVLIGFSTSGNSENILKAFKTAHELGLTTVALTGETGGKLKEFSDLLINVPSMDTPRIQESHILIGHMICEMIEAHIFPK
ncbi:MAG: D-sedoheptulose 7-phosphate isomerase [Bacteroidales bacterium]|nr:D-sedoheptulose 7-phosphate isomerase [Bacteroidales bacterium]